MTDVAFLSTGWTPLVRIVVVGVAMYIALVVLLRISRSRTLSSLNAFDFVITVAIGSAFGRALTAKNVALAEAVLAFGLLVALQYAVTWAQIRWPSVGRTVTNPPSLLYFRGVFLRDAMDRQRVTEAELQTAVRKNDHGSLSEVAAVVLESSGEFSVIGSIEDGSAFGEPLERQVDE